MDKKAVAEICRVLKVDLLDDYRKAVYRNNVAEVKRMRPESLNTAWDNGYLKRVLFDEGHLATTTQNILPVYQKKTRAWFVVHTLVAHPFYHIGHLPIIKQLVTKG